MQRRPANWPECLTTRRTQATSSGHQRFFAFGRFVGGAFARRFFLAVANRLGLTHFSFSTRFRRGFRTGNAVTQTGFVGAQLAQLLLTLLDGRLQPCQRLFTLVQRLGQLRLLCTLLIQQRLLLALFLFQLGALHSDFFTRLFQLSNGFLSRLVEIAEISL